jgi:hypothetical protein
MSKVEKLMKVLKDEDLNEKELRNLAYWVIKQMSLHGKPKI